MTPTAQIGRGGGIMNGSLGRSTWVEQFLLRTVAKKEKRKEPRTK